MRQEQGTSREVAAGRGGASGRSREGVVVRPMRPEEADAVGALTVAAYREGEHLRPDDPYYATLADGHRRGAEADVLVAVLTVDGEEAVAGTVAVARPGSDWAETAEPGELEFRMLAVHPDFHRRGVARALVQAVIDRARQTEGIDAVVLSTIISMEGAQRLYHSLGFERQPHRDWMLSRILPGLPMERDSGPFPVFRLSLT